MCDNTSQWVWTSEGPAYHTRIFGPGHSCHGTEIPVFVNYATRTNFVLSIPLLLCMASASHGLPF
jgi:hypothetical protein